MRIYWNCYRWKLRDFYYIYSYCRICNNLSFLDHLDSYTTMRKNLYKNCNRKFLLEWYLLLRLGDRAPRDYKY